MMLTGSATPMAYAIWTSQRRASPAATTFFATHRAAYARSGRPWKDPSGEGAAAVAPMPP